MSDVFLTCRLLFGHRTDAEKYLLDDPLVQISRTVLTKRPKNFLSPGRELFSASEDALLSNPGHFFLKVHDSLKSCVAILKLGKVQGRLLRKSMNLELDQSIDFLPEVQERWLRHREQLLPCYPRCDVNAV